MQAPQPRELQSNIHQSMQFVRGLSDQFAPLMTQRQANASFETGKLVDNANGTAVYVFLLAFDSLSGPQIRFEFTDSTMYCKSMEAAVPDAIVAAEQFGPEVRMYSAAASTAADAPVAPGVLEAGGDEGSDSKLWAFGVVAGVGAFRIVFLPECLAQWRY